MPFTRHLAAALIAVGALGGAVMTSPDPAAAEAAAAPSYAEQAAFQNWIRAFRPRALAQGVRAEIFDAAFRGVTLNAAVLRADRRQPEFSRPIWKYLESAVSDARVRNGREKARLHAALLPQLQGRYSVDPYVALAIWGVESAYGSYYGDYSIVEALATLAHDGRRAAWAEDQLTTALKIIQDGHISADRMKGSWAGAMGHTQFIPTSFMAYAVDFTGDGRRDLWSDDPSDALASAANYLARHGWRMGEPAFVEVVLPRGIDYAELTSSTRKSAAAWRAMGVRALDGSALPNLDEASVIIPAGARGAAFMTFHNFRVIRRYNNAASYALAVAHLADRIRGGAPLRGTWPESDRPLSRTEKTELQRKLTTLGFDTGGVDGMLGAKSRRAIRAFQRSRALPADGYASADLLTAVGRARPGAVSPAPSGLSAADIRTIQTRLNARGLNAGPVDGVVGSRTRAAVAAFQRSIGAKADGVPSAGILWALGVR